MKETDGSPELQMPSGVHLSFFGSAFVLGTPDFPLREIPFQELAGAYDGERDLGYRTLHVHHFVKMMQNFHKNMKIYCAAIQTESVPGQKMGTT